MELNNANMNWRSHYQCSMGLRGDENCQLKHNLRIVKHC